MASVRRGCNSSVPHKSGMSHSRRPRGGAAMSAEDDAGTATYEEPRLPGVGEHEEPEPEAAELFAAVDELDEEEPPELEVSTDSLQLFLKDVGKVDLLTAAQEV